MKRPTLSALLAAAGLLIAAGCAPTINVSTIPYPDVPAFAPSPHGRS